MVYGAWLATRPDGPHAPPYIQGKVPQVQAAEVERRKAARRGGEVACTRAGGLHRLGTGQYDETRRRKPEVGWEAGDVKRASRQCATGVDVSLKQIRAKRGDGDGDRGGGGSGAGSGDGGAHGGTPLPLPPPPSSPTRAGGAVRRRITTSRWQPYALEQMSAARRGGAA